MENRKVKIFASMLWDVTYLFISKNVDGQDRRKRVKERGERIVSRETGYSDISRRERVVGRRETKR